MISRPPLPAGPYLVVGLGRSGVAAVRLLRDRSKVIACDGGAPDASGLDGAEVHLESDGVAFLDRVRTVVKSPGVPPSAPVVVAARRAGVDVIGELELAWRLIPNDFIAVTGTNGKTTTTELLGAIHRSARIPVAIAGNVGTPASSVVGELDDDAIVVAECSSFQLADTTRFAPDCAVLVNISEDHLDWHGDVAAYRAAKLRAFDRQTKDCVAVAPHGLEVDTAARRVTFGANGADLEARDGALLWRGEPLIETAEIRLRGAHNLENAMAAASAALARDAPKRAISRALRDFSGVPHRLEEVGELDGVLFVNDSKATNVASTRVALEAFDGGVHLIVGGRPKGGGFQALRDAVANHCTAVYAIGEAGDALADDLAGTVPLAQAGDLEHAVEAARRAARPGEVILLSPACASYDQYKDFEARGRHFRALVEA